MADLYLDPRNPRLASHDFSVTDQAEILKVLWKEMAVNELIDSIAATDYWEHEEIFASNQDGRLVVIEGNRRVAAVKLLVDPALRQQVGASGVPDLRKEPLKALTELPVVVCDRKQIWEYVGFKHVNGPQEWDSIAKAGYIARVHNEYGIKLDEIARRIGDRHDTVKRMYRGLMVLEQAEKESVFQRDQRFNKRFSYSHLWTGLGYTGIQEFLGLTPDKGFKPNPISKKYLPNLGDLMNWLYGNKESRTKPLVQSQNPDLRNLDEALRADNGTAALRAGLPLDIALKASRGDDRLLREALVKGEVALKEAYGLVPTGFDGQSDLMAAAERILKTADSINDQMLRQPSSPRTSQRRRSRK